ncbi:hypothetical protein Gogos_008748 [Gossypium gossypioides]|uniref:Cytochrome c oxidase subunit 6b-1-like n=1 Tax=Gossypium gossypioides TaxID=34282 RepID=A0A7J9CCM4_GOSGO|nr:hypothetical protein [Gossypium gossypioides]
MQQYSLKEKAEKSDVATKAADAEEVENSASTSSKEVVTEEVETLAPLVESTEVPPAVAEENTEANPVAENSVEDAQVVVEESNERTEESSGDAEETPEIKLETAPADFRFPTTNQTRHCFTRYIEYHRCVAAKGEDASECDKFAKFYRALCPGEWVHRSMERAKGERYFSRSSVKWYFSGNPVKLSNEKRHFQEIRNFGMYPF